MEEVSFCLGDTVFVLDDDNEWYEAVVTKVHKEGTYTVKCVETRRTLRRIERLEAERPPPPTKPTKKRGRDGRIAPADFKKALMRGLKKGLRKGITRSFRPRGPKSKGRVEISDVKPWSEYVSSKKSKKEEKEEESSPKNNTTGSNILLQKITAYDFDPEINNIVRLWRGDITDLATDAIVNAANNGLHSGGGICGAIFRKAGHRKLGKACNAKGRQCTGHAVLTEGFALNAKYVAHAVGPSGRRPALLANCYRNVLDLCLQNKLRSIAFCCISTGIFGFPNELAARVAVKTVREWIEEDRENRIKAFDAIVFCVYDVQDLKLYRKYMPCAFPRQKVSSPIGDDAAILLAPNTTAQERERADEIEVADEKALRDRKEKWKSGSRGVGWGKRRKPKKQVATQETGKEEAALMNVGDRVSVGAKGEGVIRYVGMVENLPLGYWIGIELDELEGKHNGTVKGTKLFECKPGYGLCVRPKRVEYVNDEEKANVLRDLRKQLAFSGLRKRMQEREKEQKDFEKEQQEYREAQARASSAGKGLFTLVMMKDGHPRGF